MLGAKKKSDVPRSGSTAVSAVSTPESPADQPAPVQEHRPRPGAKNRPTPKRKEAEAARRQPLVVADRKAAKKAEREHAREARLAARAAAERGDDKALPLRDRGPQRRYIRDRVDSRWTIGEVALPLMLVAVLTLAIPNPYVQYISLLLVWLVVLAGVIDCYFQWRRIKKGILAKFGTVERGGARYSAMRSMQMRRARFPRPMVKRGEKVD